MKLPASRGLFHVRFNCSLSPLSMGFHPASAGLFSMREIKITVHVPELRDVVLVLMGLQQQLTENTRLICETKEQIMADLDVLNQKITDLEVAAAANAAKDDAVLAKMVDLQAQIAALQAAGTGANTADIAALAARVQAVTEAMTAETAKEDAALNPATTLPGDGQVDPNAPTQ